MPGFEGPPGKPEQGVVTCPVCGGTGKFSFGFWEWYFLARHFFASLFVLASWKAMFISMPPNMLEIVC